MTNCKKSRTARPSGDYPSKRINLWKEHFKSLLGKPASLPSHPEEIDTIVSETLPIPVHEFTMEELTSAIRSTSSGKATGLDNIPAEVCKSGALLEHLLNVCNKVFNSGEAPNIWRKAAILPIPKKWDLTNRQNYRGISLIPTKIFNKMLHNRIKPNFEKIFRMNQNDFIEGRSRIGQILALRRIIEEVQINHMPAVLDFVDFRKAFDSVSRERLFDKLAAYGVPQEIIKAIRAAYTNTTAQVIIEHGNTDFFSIEAGVLQGDTLAPYSLIIVIDYVMRTSTKYQEKLGLTITQRLSRRFPATYITDTDFADDIALLSESIEDTQCLLLKSLKQPKRSVSA